MRIILSINLILLIITTDLNAQQVADTVFQAVIENPTYTKGKGPTVLIDEAHHNFHTVEGRYQAFAKVLRKDGYVVGAFGTKFKSESLDKADVLVISNALHKDNVQNWSNPIYSAFSEEEINAVHKWVENGGALLLIADHMPFPGAARELAAAFGFKFNNGFAIDSLQRNMTIFSRSDGSLVDHPINKGLEDMEKIDSVRTFMGQAFQANDKVQPLLIFKKPAVSIMPEIAWQFKAETPRIPVDGWYQGAVLQYGKGRIAVFGEAAMFTAQYSKQKWFGMRSKGAEQNQQFLLNVMHWLTGVIKSE